MKSGIVLLIINHSNYAYRLFVWKDKHKAIYFIFPNKCSVPSAVYHALNAPGLELKAFDGILDNRFEVSTLWLLQNGPGST